jgi:hypothetical protein
MSFQLSREQFRTMILYDWKIGLTYKDSHARLVQAWGDQAPSDRTVLNRGGQNEFFQVTSQVKSIERFFKSSQVKSMASGKFSKSVKSSQ